MGALAKRSKPANAAVKAEQYRDARWRLNNLYYVLDKNGQRAPFRMNWAQESLWDEGHPLDLILKARQLGVTSFCQLVMLDACLHSQNVRAGTVAHTLDAAKVIFADKVKYPYSQLPDQLRAIVSTVNDAALELLFSNNSSIRVGTSLRSGTLQYLHVSEYAKVCAKEPEKAKEIRTGALNTVHAGQKIWVESTAEGQEGDFFDKCEAAKTKRRTGEPLSALDFKFHFFPWWKELGYTLAPESVQVPPSLATYFEALKDEHGITLTDGQRAWYVKKAEQQKDEMKREFPSTPEEAFEASLEGAYFSRQIAQAEEDKRICRVPWESAVPVETAWDLGMDDEMVLWFFQRVGKEHRFIDYYANRGEGFDHYASVMRQKPYVYSTCWLPHDAAVKELGTGKSRKESLESLRFSVAIVGRHEVADGINAARNIFSSCWFDSEKCADGLKALRAYRKEWDEEHGTFKSKARHDWASHPADAFRTFAMAPQPVPGFYRKINYPPSPFEMSGARQNGFGRRLYYPAGAR